MNSITILLAITAIISSHGEVRKKCDTDDFYYEYTSCDREGNRWRVAVPKAEKCANFTPPPPIRGKKCNFTCDPGHYLDINDQECKLCPSGTFSLGGGIRFDDWQTMPSSFSVKVEKFSLERVFLARNQEKTVEANCTGTWMASGKYLLAKYVDCPISLVYEADSVRDGSVTFYYENNDESLLFSFEVENQKCELRRSHKEDNSYKSLRQTEEGEFRKVSIPLPPGHNRLVWTVIPVSLTGIDDKKGPKKFVKIKAIEIKGVAYTSECTPCRAGTFSGKGESVCQNCPQNTFSQREADKCIPCDTVKEYSEPGSDTCLERPPCTDSDYLEIIKPCDADGQTKIVYKWNDQMVCNPLHPNSMQLPPNGPIQACPPCNPGMHLIDGICSYCPPDEFSSGRKGEECKKCPSSTAPTTGIFINFWNNLNLTYVNLSSQCFSSSGVPSDCKTKDGWVPNKDHIRSKLGHDPSAFLLLSLKVGGFKTSSKKPSSTINEEYELLDDDEENEDDISQRKGYASTSNNNVAQISFVFELSCSSDCILFFIKKTGREPLNVIETWSGPTSRTKFSYTITSPQPAVFSWTFQQVHEQISSSSSSLSMMQNLANSMMSENRAVARIYSINVTNTLGGGASGCELCPQGATRDGCVPCPEGHYIDPETKTCVMCPGNTAVSGGYAWSSKSCLECGEGLQHYNHELCISNCSYFSSKTNQTYNFSSLASPRVIEGLHFFTTSGYRYFNVFNITLCGDHRKDSPYPLASCVSNFTSHDAKEEQDETMRLGFQAPVCRSTALPSDKGPNMLTNPLSFGDRLVSITNNPKEDIVKLVKEAELYDDTKNGSDVYFVYKSEVMTRACRSGRLSVVVLRCDGDPSKEDRVSLPPKCPDGTCDGCNLVILWSTHVACPVCKPEDYVEFTQDCVDGKQKVFRKALRPCYSLVKEQSEVKTVECSYFFFFQPNAPLWVKIVTVLVALLIVIGITSMCVVIYCWKKNKKLEYKYMKLIESSSHAKDGMELPGVDSCGIDEGDEEEQFDAVEFKSSKKKNTFFSKLAGQASSRKGPGFFERVDRDEKMSLT